MHRRFLHLISLLILAFMLGGAPAAHATKPCNAPDDTAFAAIVDATPLVLRGRITASQAASDAPAENTPAGQAESWTDVEVIEIFRGGLSGRGLRINGWAAQDMPLFNYAPGNELIFLLKPAASGNNMVLANDDWASCVPALMPKLQNGGYSVNSRPMQLGTFLRDYIRKTPGLKELSTSTVGVRAGKLYITAMMGPTRPVLRFDDPAPDTVPAPDVTVEIRDKTGRMISFAMTDKKGMVDFTLPPGTYTIDAHPRPVARATNTPMTIELSPGTEERIQLDIDTGIR